MNKVLSAIALVLLIACSGSDDDWQCEDEYDFDYNVSLASSAWMDVRVQDATGAFNDRGFDGLDSDNSYISTEAKSMDSADDNEGNVVVMDGRLVWRMDTIEFTFPDICLDGRVYDVAFNQDVAEYSVVYNGEVISNADIKIKGNIKRLGVYSRSIKAPQYECLVDLTILYDTNRIDLKISEVKF